MSDELMNREIRLAARPVGEPTAEIFELAETRVPEPAEGQIVVRNTWMSVDPYMREWMREDVEYARPYELGAPLLGSAVGEVVASRSAAVPVGSTVTHFLGWREYALLDAAEATVVDTSLAPAEVYLGPLGTTGLTAYATLTRVAPVREGDVVWVSAAAGAVGSIAGQVARKLGAARVIGSAGGPEKAEKLVTTFGFDAGLDHRAGPIAKQLSEAAPGGIDVYVDNVGGDHLRAAIAALRERGRIGMVGAISGYNATEPVPGPDNLFRLASKNATLGGIYIPGHLDLFPEWIERGAAWIADGSLRYEQTVVEGLERAPEAFLGVLRGANTGKMLVRLG
ncbi:NADP-dependent oxidoreductase [[Actinomadura] parvosata subsp. kistnae]|uniref:NADP-dependent oxidoreductase n=1 Tax=[Actinomadura] parvosata subsp. kistnae TaxID=1909395 RepID=A0A1V0A9X1_9ACTN|nr:NADP-dependent oxidoreductase [Nonomuraea sp. ATCC 55076]AQZ66942.1 NADP-dependent oxidoreductase [Nonomuraea sp. ATCC 55076]